MGKAPQAPRAQSFSYRGTCACLPPSLLGGSRTRLSISFESPKMSSSRPGSTELLSSRAAGSDHSWSPRSRPRYREGRDSRPRAKNETRHGTDREGGAIWRQRGSMHVYIHFGRSDEQHCFGRGGSTAWQQMEERVAANRASPSPGPRAAPQRSAQRRTRLRTQARRVEPPSRHAHAHDGRGWPLEPISARARRGISSALDCVRCW